MCVIIRCERFNYLQRSNRIALCRINLKSAIHSAVSAGYGTSQSLNFAQIAENHLKNHIKS
jgi:hypothetical protein